MSKEFFSVIASIVTLFGLLSTWAAGVWFMSGLENRIGRLEDIGEWQKSVEVRLKETTNKININNNRWAAHYGLWGESIEKKGVERGVNTDILRPGE